MASGLPNRFNNLKAGNGLDVEEGVLSSNASFFELFPPTKYVVKQSAEYLFEVIVRYFITIQTHDYGRKNYPRTSKSLKMSLKEQNEISVTLQNKRTCMVMLCLRVFCEGRPKTLTERD